MKVIVVTAIVSAIVATTIASVVASIVIAAWSLIVINVQVVLIIILHLVSSEILH